MENKRFFGPIIKEMPLLIAEGRVPLSVADLMKIRLDLRNPEGIFFDVSDFKPSWTDWVEHDFDTGDAATYHPDGRLKIVLDSQHLRELTPKSKLEDSALILTEDSYKALQGEEFTGKQLEKYAKPELSRKDAKANPIWRVLARDKNLLNDYVDYVFAEVYGRIMARNPFKGAPRDIYAMGIKTSYTRFCPTLETWFVNHFNARSKICGGGNGLESISGSLIGYKMEQQNETNIWVGEGTQEAPFRLNKTLQKKLKRDLREEAGRLAGDIFKHKPRYPLKCGFYEFNGTLYSVYSKYSCGDERYDNPFSIELRIAKASAPDVPSDQSFGVRDCEAKPYVLFMTGESYEDRYPLYYNHIYGPKKNTYNFRWPENLEKLLRKAFSQ